LLLLAVNALSLPPECLALWRGQVSFLQAWRCEGAEGTDVESPSAPLATLSFFLGAGNILGVLSAANPRRPL
jgi:hypothetical protein